MNRYKIFFWISALLSRGIIVAFLLFSHIGLMPDEAQYWTWSQFLDFGYYSKPPGIAWQIFLSTHLFGPTELGIRGIPLILPIFSALLIARIVYKITQDNASSYLAATAFILSPLGCSASFCATTDNPMIFFYLSAVYAYIAIKRPIFRYLACGILIAFGGLFKWVIYTLHAAFFRKAHIGAFCLGFAVSVLGLLPSAYWNATHDFATFRHVAMTLFGTHTSAAHPNFFLFLIASIFLVTPGFFALALPSLGILSLGGFFHGNTKNRETNFVLSDEKPKTQVSNKNDELQTLTIACAILWGGCLFMSCFKKAQVNWAVAGQTLFFPLLGVGLYLHRSWQKLPYIAALLTSVLLQGFVLATPFFASKFLFLSPFKQGLGLEEMQNGLSLSGYNPECDFLFSSRYQTTSLLWFYGKGQKRTYFFNIEGVRHNQYMYWPGMRDECTAKNGYYVILARSNEKNHLSEVIEKAKRKLKPYFLRVDEHTVYPLKSIDQTVVYYMIIVKAILYNGSQPNESLKY